MAAEVWYKECGGSGDRVYCLTGSRAFIYVCGAWCSCFLDRSTPFSSFDRGKTKERGTLLSSDRFKFSFNSASFIAFSSCVHARQ